MEVIKLISILRHFWLVCVIEKVNKFTSNSGKFEFFQQITKWCLSKWSKVYKQRLKEIYNITTSNVKLNK